MGSTRQMPGLVVNSSSNSAFSCLTWATPARDAEEADGCEATREAPTPPVVGCVDARNSAHETAAFPRRTLAGRREAAAEELTADASCGAEEEKRGAAKVLCSGLFKLGFAACGACRQTNGFQDPSAGSTRERGNLSHLLEAGNPREVFLGCG